jgi:hypothetical protein
MAGGWTPDLELPTSNIKRKKTEQAGEFFWESSQALQGEFDSHKDGRFVSQMTGKIGRSHARKFSGSGAVDSLSSLKWLRY